jgi:GT2 family glycosyltransferase
MGATASEIGIGITTKDRWNDLEVTLEHLRSTGLDRLETLVIDDGSKLPLPADFPTRFPWVKFERFEKSQGLITRRNYLVRSLKAPFYLSLDDDSFPIVGDLEAAAAWMREHPKTAVLGFKIILNHEPRPADAPAVAPIATRDFTGCGFLMRRELFLSLGGFDDRLGMYCEEMEFALRAVCGGYEIYCYPSVVILHLHSPRGRDNVLRTRVIIRNHVLISLWFYPFPDFLIRGLWWSFMKTPFPNKKTLAIRRSIYLGALEGWIRFFQWRDKKRLTREQFREWMAKPYLASL